MGTGPVMMKPPIPTLSPVSTYILVERFKAWLVDGVGVAVGVGVGVDVAVAVAVAVAVGVDVAVAVGVDVAVAVGVGVGGTVTLWVVPPLLEADKVSD